MTTKEEKRFKRISRRARLHIKIVNARSRKIPGKVAWIAALFAAACAGAYSHSYGGLVGGAAVIMFIICAAAFQILSRLVFGIIGIITARAYNRQQDGDFEGYRAGWGSAWNEDDDWQSHRYNDASSQGTAYDSTGYEETYDENSYDDNTYGSNDYYDGGRGYSDSSQYQQQYENTYGNAGQSDTGMSIEQALKIFGVTLGNFSSSDLKKIWREMIKKNHPDQNVDAGCSDKYEETTKQINTAYDILKGYACDA